LYYKGLINKQVTKRCHFVNFLWKIEKYVFSEQDIHVYVFSMQSAYVISVSFLLLQCRLINSNKITSIMD